MRVRGEGGREREGERRERDNKFKKKEKKKEKKITQIPFPIQKLHQQDKANSHLRLDNDLHCLGMRGREGGREGETWGGAGRGGGRERRSDAERDREMTER